MLSMAMETLYYGMQPVGYEEITRRLLETSKVHAKKEKKAGKYAFGTEVQKGQVEVVRVLLPGEGETLDSEPLFQAVEKGNLGVVQ